MEKRQCSECRYYLLPSHLFPITCKITEMRKRSEFDLRLFPLEEIILTAYRTFLQQKMDLCPHPYGRVHKSMDSPTG